MRASLGRAGLLALLAIAAGCDTSDADRPATAAVGEAGPGTPDSIRESSETAAGSAAAPVLADDSTALARFDVPGWERLQEPWVGDLDEMVERRLIRAGVVHSRTLFFVDGARPRGATYEGLTRFEQALNEQLGTGHLKVHVVLIPVPRGELLTALSEGRIDIAAANLTVTPDRRALVDFAPPLLRGVSEVLVTGMDGPAIQTLRDLSGLEVHVRRSSSHFESLERLNTTLTAQGLAPARVVEVDDGLESEDLLELVNVGVIPATVVDSHIAEFWAQVFDGLLVHAAVPLREEGEVAWAIRKDSPALAEVLTTFVEEHRQGTLLGNIVLRRYLGSAEYIVNPAGTDDRQRFDAARPVFETYAVRYGFDPLMLIAQAYQESRLNQDLVSSAGAIGVMQLLPGTAADPNVGIPDISTIEDNVHAGAKYMRFLLDRYFADGDLDPLDEHLFAFAAYNAGPARVARLRAEAEQLGLDPDRWFRNVEHVAARRIGRETVQYVSNIYKYYLAYSRLEHLEGPDES